MKQPIFDSRRKLARQTSVVLSCLLLTLNGMPAEAACPAGSGSTLILRAPAGNLTVDTSAAGVIEISLSSKAIQLQEVCGADVIRVEGVATAALREIVDWKIRVPKTVNLDLMTNGGSITVIGNSEGEVILRTSGGSVTAQNIKRKATLYTQAGSIRVFDIGGNAELRSEGGNLELGNVGGDAFLKTASGWIRSGNIGGSVTAETGGGNITIKNTGGERFLATTKAGNISVSGAGRIEARTEGGAINVGRARGAFLGHTDIGDIKIDQASGSVDAVSGFGDIFVRLDPDSLGSNYHINIQTGNGDITFYLPETMRASIDASVDRVASNARQPIIADFPMTRSAFSSLLPTNAQSGVRNGGGPPMTMRAATGTIQIRFNP
jgi:DUF4097 and DUF4098 domain-containing protein YvlB